MVSNGRRNNFSNELAKKIKEIADKLKEKGIKIGEKKEQVFDIGESEMLSISQRDNSLYLYDVSKLENSKSDIQTRNGKNTTKDISEGYMIKVDISNKDNPKVDYIIENKIANKDALTNENEKLKQVAAHDKYQFLTKVVDQNNNDVTKSYFVKDVESISEKVNIRAENISKDLDNKSLENLKRTNSKYNSDEDRDGIPDRIDPSIREKKDQNSESKPPLEEQEKDTLLAKNNDIDKKLEVYNSEIKKDSLPEDIKAYYETQITELTAEKNTITENLEKIEKDIDSNKKETPEKDNTKDEIKKEEQQRDTSKKSIRNTLADLLQDANLASSVNLSAGLTGGSEEAGLRIIANSMDELKKVEQLLVQVLKTSKVKDNIKNPSKTGKTGLVFKATKEVAGKVKDFFIELKTKNMQKSDDKVNKYLEATSKEKTEPNVDIIKNMYKEDLEKELKEYSENLTVTSKYESLLNDRIEISNDLTNDTTKKEYLENIVIEKEENLAEIKVQKGKLSDHDKFIKDQGLFTRLGKSKEVKEIEKEYTDNINNRINELSERNKQINQELKNQDMLKTLTESINKNEIKLNEIDKELDNALEKDIHEFKFVKEQEVNKLNDIENQIKEINDFAIEKENLNNSISELNTEKKEILDKKGERSFIQNSITKRSETKEYGEKVKNIDSKIEKIKTDIKNINKKIESKPNLIKLKDKTKQHKANINFIDNFLNKHDKAKGKEEKTVSMKNPERSRDKEISKNKNKGR